MSLPRKILVANRGEIAVRVMRGCHELGIPTVAVFSEVDRTSLHVRMASEAYCIGPAPSNLSYLRADKILAVAKAAGCDAIHPGYGFLSENADFAQLVIASGIIWIGAPPDSIRAMGSKTESRQRMIAAGVPVVPGTTEALTSAAQAKQIAGEIGYPVMLKASAGGGGKGMREVTSAAAIEDAFRAARSEARNSFGDDSVYVEKRIVEPRHVEVQILADKYGSVLHLFERDCSIQRRHQKVVEETPCPVLRDEVRQQMAEIAIQAAKAVNYEGAGTVEFLLGEDQSFYFLEMNTRLQVEHPITEMVTGVDLVQWQIRVAAGQKLALQQSSIKQFGHAIECRVYAEDAANNWVPSPGKITGYKEPTGPWIRVDSGVYQNAEVSVYYDPMVSKLIVWGFDREDAIRRLRRALQEYRIRGIQTSIPFFKALLDDESFLSGRYSTAFLSEQKMRDLTTQDTPSEIASIAAAIAAFEKDMRWQNPTEPAKKSTNRWKWSYR